jgi:CubicO group peptidase (beta-lactamase class C family)
VLLTTVLTAPTLTAQAPAGFDAAWSRVRTQFHDRLREEGVVGGSLWFVHDDRVLAREFFGFAELASERAVDEYTIYHWASITKTFTGVAIMQLRDRGLLRLDDPVVDYLPELQGVHDPFGSVRDITIRHLLSHSSGFRGPTWPWGGEPWHPHEPTAWEQLVAMVPYTRIHFRPGSRFGYSNPGIIFLGRIIEMLTGDDYEVYVDKNILKPLGMYRSYFDRTPYHLLPYRSNNYYVEDGVPAANGLDFDTGITVSNGGLNAPITDMVTYLRWLAGDSAVMEPAAGVLRRSSLEEMWMPRVPVPAEPGDSVAESVGLAFFTARLGSIEVIGHTGEQKAFLSFFSVDPTSGAAAIAALNTLGISSAGPPVPNTRRIRAELRALLLIDVFPLFR